MARDREAIELEAWGELLGPGGAHAAKLAGLGRSVRKKNTLDTRRGRSLGKKVWSARPPEAQPHSQRRAGGSAVPGRTGAGGCAARALTSGEPTRAPARPAPPPVPRAHSPRDRAPCPARSTPARRRGW